jgi:hypothetical protein
VAWSSKPTFSGNFTVVEAPGEVTFSRSATYQQTNYVDPDTGETFPGCLHEPSPADVVSAPGPRYRTRVVELGPVLTRRSVQAVAQATQRLGS